MFRFLSNVITSVELLAHAFASLGLPPASLNVLILFHPLNPTSRVRRRDLLHRRKHPLPQPSPMHIVDSAELKATNLRDLAYMGGWKNPQTVLLVYQQPDLELQREALAGRKKMSATG